MTIATLTSKGQLTVPKDIRDLFHLSTGDKVEFTMDDRGEVRMKPVNKSLLSLQGALRRPGKRAVSQKQMDKAIRQGVRRPS